MVYDKYQHIYAVLELRRFVLRFIHSHSDANFQPTNIYLATRACRIGSKPVVYNATLWPENE